MGIQEVVFRSLQVRRNNGEHQKLDNDDWLLEPRKCKEKLLKDGLLKQAPKNKNQSDNSRK